MSKPAIPSSWAFTKLGRVTEYGRVNKAEPNEIEDSAWVLELEDIEKNTSKLLARVSFADRQSKSTKNRFEAGDVLYGKLRPYLNKVIIADNPGYCTTEIIPLKAGQHLDNRYLFYWLKHPTFLDYVEAESHGLNMPRLGTETGRAAPFILAPLNEQQRIADKLDAVLARVDACRDRLDRIPAILKRFRQSVLAAAASGKLTEGWRENETIRKADSISGWYVSKIKELISEIGLFSDGDWIESKDQDPNGGIRLIQLADIGDGVFLNKSNRFINNDAFERINCTELQSGDVLVARMPDPLGRACLFPDIGKRSITAVDVAILRPCNSIINNRWLVYAINAPMIRAQMHLLASGTTRQRVTRKNLGEIELTVPHMKEQQAIVRRIESMFAYADRLEARYTSAHAQVEKLTPSLLVKAFRGELVPQDPNDEPASALLARIAAERTIPSKKKTTRKPS